jgi:signal transduction histidine kinase
LAPGLPKVIGDRDALVTVLVNLLDNALKYSGDEKKIQLRGSTSNGNVYLEVQDNGIGFPRSAAKKIFDRFYQVDQSLSRRTGGCGLGLSIVKFIVAAHKGSITAKSQPGKGSTFTVQLPAA